MSVKVKKTKDTGKDVSKAPDHKIEKPMTSEGLLQHPLLTLREEVDHLFDNFFSGFALGPFGSSRRNALHTPTFHRFENAFAGLHAPFESMHMKTDVRETDDAYRIEAELPGLKEDDIEVTATDGILTVSAVKIDEAKEDQEDYHLTERRYGSVKRSFPIPDGVEIGKAKANFKNGVLSIIMPKKTKPQSKAKKIPISGD